MECAALVKKSCTFTTTRTDSKIDVVIIIITSHRYKGFCDDDVTFFSPALRKSGLVAPLINPGFHAEAVNTRRYD